MRAWLLLGFCTIGLGVSGYFVFNSDIFRVQDVEVISYEPNFLFDEYKGDVITRLGGLRGQHILGVNLAQVENSLAQLGWVKDFSIQRKLPDRIVVEVLPKKVIALAQVAPASFSLLLDSGDLLQPISPSRVPDLPLVRGRHFQKNRELRKKAIGLISSLPEKGNFSRETIAEVTEEDQNLWVSLMASSIKIKINEPNLQLKLARVEKVLEYLDSHSLKTRVIDADFSKKVLVKLRKRR